ncbi:hypothetical protein UFOVP4_35 [uncultured Caudovirales phage]|uniref:Uncharacterized protein n=1 Tax=uncultured Caudovirales phage TaxID=2100421 RepID=A0A6J5T9M6_9CAUD|nr:hypothetical protein UFOVP4_35 [uncultured Caudovirales phage]CAB4241271.1 hypothetical protein UFOVP64_25 [uncultured Caudovirales phage]CAB5078998.1 hypothetical protein UFOVP145_39 [uncultured Caudovirales phage]
MSNHAASLCLYCGRDNEGYEMQPCSDDCPGELVRPCGRRCDFAKIDLYVRTNPASDRWDYVASTNWSKTCREAADRLAQLNPDLARVDIRAHFAERTKK